MNPHLDYRKFVALMLPTFLRGAITLSVMRSLVQPLVSLSDKRLLNRDKTLFELQHTGQTCYLRDALNKQFGFSRADGFEITDVVAEGYFLTAYDETDYLSERHLIIPDVPDSAIAWDETTIFSTKNFTVLCPSAIYDDAEGAMPVVRKIVEKYRLVSRLPEYKRKS